MKKILILLLCVLGIAGAEPRQQSSKWSEYEMEFNCEVNHQPRVTTKWYSMEINGAFQEYPQPWRKGMRIGYNKRFLVTKVSGLDYDGKAKPGAWVEIELLDLETKKTIKLSKAASSYKSYTKEWADERTRKFSEKLQPVPAETKAVPMRHDAGQGADVNRPQATQSPDKH